jgi:hypothetical protein
VRLSPLWNTYRLPTVTANHHRSRLHTVPRCSWDYVQLRRIIHHSARGQFNTIRERKFEKETAFTMSRPFPYTYISCPCADTPVPDRSRKRRSRESPTKKPELGAPSTVADTEEEEEEEEQTFDPRAPRSNFSLYPPEQLLYCEDCHQIKCPRCITEEIVCWYCPNCLFETPSSMVRSEGNRWVPLSPVSPVVPR